MTLTKEQIEEWLGAARRMPQQSLVPFLEYSDFVAVLEMARRSLQEDKESGALKDVRERALEEAAGECDHRAKDWEDYWQTHHALKFAAEAIRSLKSVHMAVVTSERDERGQD